MAFMAAEIIRLVVSRSKRLRAPSKEFMLRLWVSLFLAITTIALFRSFIPLATFLRHELVPHLRDSALAVFNTQPLLFLLLNSIIFAVLAPSGLFSDQQHECSSKSEFVTSTSACDSTESVGSSSTDSSLDSSGDLKQDHQEVESMPSKVESAERAEVSPPKARVKRKKNALHKSSSAANLKQQIAVGIVERNDPLLRYSKSTRNPADSLKDEDFKQLIDSYIAHAREQMIKQDDPSSAARSRV